MSINTLARLAAEPGAAMPQPPSKEYVLAGLTKYIPTESITLYVAAVSSLPALKETVVTATNTYWFFVCLTPILLLLLFLGHLANAGKDWKISVAHWPWWKIVASTVAFSVWALAVPGNPLNFTDSAMSGVIAGFAALFVSTFLNILTPFFEKTPPNTP